MSKDDNAIVTGYVASIGETVFKLAGFLDSIIPPARSSEWQPAGFKETHSPNYYRVKKGRGQRRNRKPKATLTSCLTCNATF